MQNIKAFGWLLTVAWLAILICSSCILAQESEEHSAKLDSKQRYNFVELFASAHDGWSLDEVLIQDELRANVIKAFRDAGYSLSEVEIFEELIALRKSGKLDAKATKQNRQDTEDILPIAEIAARRALEETKESLDRVFINPELLAKFDRFAREVQPEVDLYLVRKSALKLRKSRQLRPELLSRVTDWKVEITSFSLANIQEDLSNIPKRPGIYIFRDATGYLYIGQSKDLRDRLTKHIKESDRVALADYLGKGNSESVVLELHVFGEGSPAEDTVVREAYESELIRTRKPKLNLAP